MEPKGSLAGLRVLIPTSNYNGKSDGVTLTMSRWEKHVRSLGAKILVVTIPYAEPELREPDLAEVDEIVYSDHSIQGGSGYRVALFSYKIEEAINAFRPHLLHFSTPDPMSCACLRWARHRGIPILGTYHTNYPYLFRSHAFLAPFENAVRNIGLWSYGMCDRVLAPTRTIANELVEDGMRADTIAVWGRGVDTSTFGPRLRNIRSRRELLGLPSLPETSSNPSTESSEKPSASLPPERETKRSDDGVVGVSEDCKSEEEEVGGGRVGGRAGDAETTLETASSYADDDGAPIVLFVGRLVPEKNLKAFGETLQELRRRGVPFHGAVIGHGSHMDWMKSICPPDTVFLGHVGDLTRLGRLIASADLFLFPSVFETFGRVTVEAMASGLPVVAGAGGGTLDIVREGESGYLVDPDDYTAFADRCQALLTDTALRQRMAQTALKDSEAFSWDPLMEQMTREYHAVLANATKSRGLEHWSQLCVPKPVGPRGDEFTAMDEDGGLIRWATAGAWAVGGWNDADDSAAPAATEGSVLWWLGGGMWEGAFSGWGMGTTTNTTTTTTSPTPPPDDTPYNPLPTSSPTPPASSVDPKLIEATAVRAARSRSIDNPDEKMDPHSVSSRPRERSTSNPIPPGHTHWGGRDGWGALASVLNAWFGSPDTAQTPPTAATPKPRTPTTSEAISSWFSSSTSVTTAVAAPTPSA